MHDIFGEPISVYTREQGLEDGALVDVSQTAAEAGFKFPVALTAALWADINDIPDSKQGIQDVDGRLWDVLWMARGAVNRAGQSGDQVVYSLVMHVGRSTYYRVKAHIGPGDEGEPVITLMRPQED